MERDSKSDPLPSSILDPRRILVRGVNWLGDAVMTTPPLMRLRERFPDSHITLLTPEKLRELWLHDAAVNAVLTFAPGESVLSVGRKLRAERFDLALVLPNSPRSALEPWLGRIPHRVGYRRPWRNWLLTEAVPARAGAVKMRKRSAREIRDLVAADASRRPSSDRPVAGHAHHIHDYLHLAASLGARPDPLPPQLRVRPDEVEEVRRKFGLTDGAKRVLGLNPGAEYGPAKRWPADRFVAAAREIQNRMGCLWLILGGPGDLSVAEQIASGLGSPAAGVRNLAGATSLRELCGLLKICGALLTNDSGPMHVAAALGTPVVVPFGSTAPELTGPGLPGDPRHRLLVSNAPCAPCFRRECPIDFRCLTGIAVERVVEAVVETLNL
jgi:heptosyltransferase II